MSKHSKILLVLSIITNLFWVVDVFNGGSFTFGDFVEVVIFALIIWEIKKERKEKKFDNSYTILIVVLSLGIVIEILDLII